MSAQRNPYIKPSTELWTINFISFSLLSTFLRSINLLTKERNVKATQRRGNQTEAKAIGLIIVKDDIKSKKLHKTLQCVYIFKFH